MPVTAVCPKICRLLCVAQKVKEISTETPTAKTPEQIIQEAPAKGLQGTVTQPKQAASASKESSPAGKTAVSSPDGNKPVQPQTPTEQASAGKRQQGKPEVPAKSSVSETPVSSAAATAQAAAPPKQQAVSKADAPPQAASAASLHASTVKQQNGTKASAPDKQVWQLA